eukprot:GEMP01049270.1.p1 GENE.GEMP01049270.1~~GEMP01049270.1.p1  ORF type:complete len:226 (+),score=41.99 GEMP01049270.1:94-771(+)
MSSFEKGQTNTLRYHEDFTKSQETQEFFLMEIDEMPENEENEENEDPKQDLTIGYFKGTLKEEAVMCTEKKSSYLISQENSNTSFVAKKMDDNAFHIVCDLQDVIILKDSAPRFSTAVELLKKAPLGSDEVVTWDDFHYHVEASDVALYEFVKRPFCVSRAPSEWQWMAPQMSFCKTVCRVTCATQTITSISTRSRNSTHAPCSTKQRKCRWNYLNGDGRVNCRR